MIYKFQIVSQESLNFKLEIAVDSKSSFYELHVVIQEALHYQSHQLASFFVYSSKENKIKEISLIDAGKGMNGFPNFTMIRTKLSDLITSKEFSILYTFDLFNNRSLNFELTGIVMKKNLKEPLVTLSEGDAPVQILEEEFTAEESTIIQEDDILNDFGVLEDYAKIFGEMEDF